MNILNQEFVAPAGAMILVIILYVFFFNEKKKIMILFLSILVLGTSIEILAAVNGMTVTTIVGGPNITDKYGLNSQFIEMFRVGGIIAIAALVSIAMTKYTIKSKNSIVSNIGIVLYSLGGVQVVFYAMPALILDRAVLVAAIMGYCSIIGVICTLFEAEDNFEESEEIEGGDA